MATHKIKQIVGFDNRNSVKSQSMCMYAIINMINTNLLDCGQNYKAISSDTPWLKYFIQYWNTIHNRWPSICFSHENYYLFSNKHRSHFIMKNMLVKTNRSTFSDMCKTRKLVRHNMPSDRPFITPPNRPFSKHYWRMADFPFSPAKSKPPLSFWELKKLGATLRNGNIYVHAPTPPT